jgi:hypothetical protein
MSDPSPDLPALHQRKRVIAREVSEAEVEAANQQAAALAPVEFAPAIVAPGEGLGLSPAAAEAVTVVDPTTLGRRYRRSSHNKLYRWTQACALSSAGLATASMFCTMGDEVGLGVAGAVPAIALGLTATVLSGRSSLSARWRGWAIATTVFAATALGLTWVQRALTADEPAPRGRPVAPG